MVYRGKPSPGCDNCRKAKKRCGLELPACSRCVKLNHTCSGYRDTTSLQVQDESALVKSKVDRQNSRTSTSALHSLTKAPHTITGNNARSNLCVGLSLQIDSESPSVDSLKHELPVNELLLDAAPDIANHDCKTLPASLMPSADEVARVHFFSHFTAQNGHWHYLRESSQGMERDPVVHVAIRACGMAALTNIRYVPHGFAFSRMLYATALRRLNIALQDPDRSKTNESLIAVSMLSYYEHITCERYELRDSWKAHILGSVQLLKLRGRSQFESAIGRTIYRDVRGIIAVRLVWEKVEPPPFLWEWENDLAENSPQSECITDGLFLTMFEYASVKARYHAGAIAVAEALKIAIELESKAIEWEITTLEKHEDWQYHDVRVPHSPHVWNGVLHSYGCFPAALMWNTYRSIRIQLSRTKELLLRNLESENVQRDAQLAATQAVGWQMAEDICKAIPATLGHAATGDRPRCMIIFAYHSVWPLFLAGVSTLERLRLASEDSVAFSVMTAQICWIIGRLDYITRSIGVKWADGMMARLQDSFWVQQNVFDKLHSKLLLANPRPMGWRNEQISTP